MTRVIDGDTIDVLIDGRRHRVRYIGVDTPETVHPERGVEWMGPQASQANAALVSGRRVVLEKDVSETDRYGRLLRYVWLRREGAWLLVNLVLVQRGYGQVVTYPPDVKYVESYLAAQREAREAERGLWGAPPPAAATPRPTSGSGCDPSYAGVCIPPPPPDLDCPDVAAQRFSVRPPDPHRFDGDGDGVGCES